MPGRLRRRALGYPVPNLLSGYAVLTLNQYLQIGMPTGPGELTGIMLWSSLNVATIFYNMWINVLADGVAHMNSVWRDYVMIPTNYTAHGLFSTDDMLAADVVNSSMFIPVPYESTCTVTLTNKVAGNLTLVWCVLGRTGA